MSDYIKLNEKDFCTKFREENEKKSYYEELRSAFSRAESRATQNTDMLNALAQQQKLNQTNIKNLPASSSNSTLKSANLALVSTNQNKNSTSPVNYTRSSTNSTPDSFDLIESKINKHIETLKHKQQTNVDEKQRNTSAESTTETESTNDSESTVEQENESDPLFDYKNRRNPSALYRYRKIENMRKEQTNSRLARSHHKTTNHLPQAVLANNSKLNVASNSTPLQASVVKITKTCDAEQILNYRLTRTPRVSISSDTKNSAGEMEIKVRSLLYRSTSSASFDGPFFDSISEIEKIRQQLRDEFTNIASGAGRPYADRVPTVNATIANLETNSVGPVLVPRLNSAQILNKINQTNVQFSKNPNQKKSVSLDNYYYTQQLREKLKQIVKKQQLQYTTLSSQNKKSMQINESKDKLSIDDQEENLEQQSNNFNILNNNETNNNISVSNNNKTNAHNRISSRFLIANRKEMLKSAVHTNNNNNNNNNNSATTNPSRINSSIRHWNSNQIAYVGSSHSYKLNYESKITNQMRNVPMFISGKSYSIPDVKLNQIKLKP